MAGQYTALVSNWKSTVLVDHPRLGRVRMNASAYDPATCGPILEGPNLSPPTRSVIDPPLKDPKVDDAGRRIAEQASPVYRE